VVAALASSGKVSPMVAGRSIVSVVAVLLDRKSTRLNSSHQI